MSVKTLILKITPPKKPTQHTHHTPHPHACATHMQGRERRNETTELAVCSSTFICLLSYFLLPLRHSKKEEGVTTSKIFSKPSSEHNIFRCIYLN